jgi:hypothetical protein
MLRWIAPILSGLAFFLSLAIADPLPPVEPGVKADCSNAGGCPTSQADCENRGGKCNKGGTHGENGWYDPNGDGCGCKL